ncbi:similar to An14g03760 [Aspergillus luchuensis]|uniref:Similar to An14g03760 n=1 Tax=Aspergillus kawachii TaxID=1069201 RepID=A0A146F0R8_ASPKA|nr:similar to An14g03760 [Aspergillus luchuensis]
MSPLPTPNPTPITKSSLIGAWTLISYIAEPPNPQDDEAPTHYYPMGPDVRGTLVYTPDGQVTVSVLPKVAKKVWENSNDGVMYAGRYWIEYSGSSDDGDAGDGDERQQQQQQQGRVPIVHHEVDMASSVEFEGSQKRQAVISPEGRLRLSGLGLMEVGTNTSLAKSGKARHLASRQDS